MKNNDCGIVNRNLLFGQTNTISTYRNNAVLLSSKQTPIDYVADAAGDSK